MPPRSCLAAAGARDNIVVMRNQSARGGTLIVILFVASTLVVARVQPAAACGGGVVAPASVAPGMDAQRILLSYNNHQTEVVTVVKVPGGADGVGVLIPVSALPTLDPDPVPLDELDLLTRSTDPLILTPSTDSGSGCGCPGIGPTSKGGAGAPSAVQIGASVTIGPVTATILDGKSPAALEGWLLQNQFVIPPGQQALLQSYTGEDHLFVAIRRSDASGSGDAGTTAVTPAVTAVGVHMSLPGDQRLLPLRFARLGAGADVGFTIFVAASTGVKASPPFDTLSIDDLDSGELRGGGYASALLKLARAHDNHAFVAEHRSSVQELQSSGAIGPRLKALLDPAQVLTRLSTRLPSSGLTDDVDFTRPDASPVPTRRTLQAASLVGAGPRCDRDSRSGGSGGGTSAILILTSALLLVAIAARGMGRARPRPVQQPDSLGV
jgi:hypothetical protein